MRINAAINAAELAKTDDEWPVCMPVRPADGADARPGSKLADDYGRLMLLVRRHRNRARFVHLIESGALLLDVQRDALGQDVRTDQEIAEMAKLFWFSGAGRLLLRHGLPSVSSRCIWDRMGGASLPNTVIRSVRPHREKP